jgi:uncharacterized damage-inducible protein DinB
MVMKETTRIAALFDDLYNGEPWIDMTLKGVLRKITAKQAARRISPEYNSVWEIVNHIIKWRIHVLERLNGEPFTVGSDNYFEKITDKSDKAWKNTLKQLEDSQKKWAEFLRKLKDSGLDKINPRSGKTYYWHIHAIIQHDAYHLGQMVMLAKKL